jgi:hypothetical protein
MNEYHLYIDELGTADPKDGLSDVYILCGCAIPEFKRDNLKIKADQIKYKYWGKTDFPFHSREIGRNEGVFSIFDKDVSLKKQFNNELVNFLSKTPGIIFSVVIDKKVASEKDWDSVQVVKSTAYFLIQNFISIILSSPKSRGKIIIESGSADKDKYYLDAFSYFLSPKATEFGVSYKDVQKQVTSISFVSKHNLDIEEQLADLFAYGVKCKYDRDVRGKTFTKNSYEDRLIKIVDTKAFKKPTKVDKNRLSLLSNIESFLMLP